MSGTSEKYKETIKALATAAPKLSPEQRRKLAATFGGGPR